MALGLSQLGLEVQRKDAPPDFKHATRHRTQNWHSKATARYQADGSQGKYQQVEDVEDIARTTHKDRSNPMVGTTQANFDIHMTRR